MIEICDVSDVAGPYGHRVEIEGTGLFAVFGLDGAYFVIDDLCTHGSASLADGRVRGEEVICPFHRGSFNIRTGEVIRKPCIIPIRTYSAHVIGTKICIAEPPPIA